MSELALDNVWVTLSGIDIIRGVTLTFHSGINGLIGPNGAGKSTLINAVGGAVPIRQGEVRLNGHRISGSRPDQIARHGITRTFQIPRPVRGVQCQGFVGLSGASSQDVNRALAQAGLTGKERVHTTELTLPELRRLEFARALAMQPKILIMDEVMAGLSIVEQQSLLDVVREVADSDVMIIMVEHIMSAVRALCATTTVLSDGTVLLSGLTSDVLQDSRTIEAYLGSASAAEVSERGGH